MDTNAGAEAAEKAGESTVDFLLGMIPETLVSAFTAGEVLQTLLVALLVGFALQAMGKAGEPVLRGIGHLQKVVFRVLGMVMWTARSVRSARSPGWSARRAWTRSSRWPSS